MPRIQQITQQVAPGEQPGVIPSLPSGFGQGRAKALQAQAQATSDIARAAAGIGQHLQAVQDRQDQWDAQIQFAEFQNKFAQDYQKLKSTVKPGADGFAESAIQLYDESSQKFMENAPTSTGAQKQLQLQLTKLKGHVAEDSVAFQSTERAKDQTTKTEAILGNYQNQARANPANLSAILDSTTKLIESTVLPDPIKRDLIAGATTKLWDSALDGSVANLEKNATDVSQIDAFENQLRSGKLGYQKSSSPRMYDSALTRLDARRRELGVENRSLWNKDKADALIDLQKNGTTNIDISEARNKAIHPDQPDLVKRDQEEFHWAQQYYNWTQNSRLTSPAEDKQLLDNIDTQVAGRGAQYKAQYDQKFRTFMADKYKQISKDLVAYILKTSPNLADSYQKAQKSGDPAAMGDVIAKMDGMQDQLDIPNYRRQYLGKGAATQAIQKFTSKDTTAEQTILQLQNMKQTYGDKWPNVYNELRADGMHGPITTVARLDTANDVGISTRIMQGIKAGGTKELAKSLQPSEVAQINENLKDAMAPFRQSLAYAGAGGQGIINDELDAARILAYQYTTQDGMSPGDAADKAYQQTLGNRYDFGPGYRTPKGMSGMAEAFSQDMLQKLKPEQFTPAAVGPNTDPALGEFGTEDYRRRAAWSNAVNNGIWVNNEEGNGILLMVPDDTSGSDYRPLKLANGKRVEMTFEQMQQQGVPSSVTQRWEGPPGGGMP